MYRYTHNYIHVHYEPVGIVNTVKPLYSTWNGSFFLMKKWAAPGGIQTQYSLDQCSYHYVTEAAQWLWAELGKARQGKYLYTTSW